MADKLASKPRGLFALLLAAGIAIGVLISNFYPFKAPVPTVTSEAVKTLVETDPQIPQEPQPEKPEQATPAQTLATETNPDLQLIAILNRRLEEEKLGRQQLEQTLLSLQNELQTLAHRFDELESTARNRQGQQGQTQNTRQRIDTATLISAGFNIGDAELIAEQWHQQEMDMLYLRDQASREGWLDTPEFREAAQDLRLGLDSLWENLGGSAYDRFLYATGQPNRVQISSVIDSSPGQVIGLQAGDIVLSYAGTSIYSGQDLQSATTAGEADEAVLMQIIRDDTLIELSIPRGPIGISMIPVSIAPQS